MSKYVQRYAKIIVPMANQLKSNSKNFIWKKQHQCPFDMIKQALGIAPILAIVDSTRPYVVETNASDKAISAILLQEDRPIIFKSKKLDKAQ